MKSLAHVFFDSDTSLTEAYAIGELLFQQNEALSSGLVQILDP